MCWSRSTHASNTTIILGRGPLSYISSVLIIRPNTDKYEQDRLISNSPFRRRCFCRLPDFMCRVAVAALVQCVIQIPPGVCRIHPPPSDEYLKHLALLVRKVLVVVGNFSYSVPSQRKCQVAWVGRIRELVCNQPPFGAGLHWKFDEGVILNFLLTFFFGKMFPAHACSVSIAERWYYTQAKVQQRNIRTKVSFPVKAFLTHGHAQFSNSYPSAAKVFCHVQARVWQIPCVLVSS